MKHLKYLLMTAALLAGLSCEPKTSHEDEISFLADVDGEATKALDVDASALSSFTVEAFVAGNGS